MQGYHYCSSLLPCIVFSSLFLLKRLLLPYCLLLHTRTHHTVLYAYEQCLLCFGHCADIWYEAALYLQRASETGVSSEYYSLMEPLTKGFLVQYYMDM